MAKGSAALDRATAEVIEIVRELLDLEERKRELEAALQKYIDPDTDVSAILGRKLTKAYNSTVERETANPAEVKLEEGPPNRMTKKSNELACPFSGCNYIALSKVDFADHIAGCQPNDIG